MILHEPAFFFYVSYFSIFENLTSKTSTFYIQRKRKQKKSKTQFSLLFSISIYYLYLVSTFGDIDLAIVC